MKDDLKVNSVQLICEMTNRPYKIFTMPSQVTGRNANIAGTMMKKAQMTVNNVPQRVQIQPFSGYSFPTTENSLSTSQVSEYNSEGLRKVIRQQLEKKLKEEKQKNDMGIMKAEIKSLKESFQDLSKLSQQRLGESNIQNKQQTQQMVEKMMKDHQKQTALNLKKVVHKMHQDMKKDFIGYMNKEFIPISFIDDLQKQLNEIEDRIQIVESKVEGENNKPNKERVVYAETIELRMNKIDRQIENIRKSLNDYSSKLKIQEQNINNIIQMTQIEKDTFKFELDKIKTQISSHQHQFKKVNNLQINHQNLKLDIQFLKNQIQQLQKDKQQHSIKINDLNTKYSNNIHQSLKQYIINDQNLDNSIIVNSSFNGYSKDDALLPSNNAKINPINSKSPKIEQYQKHSQSPNNNQNIKSPQNLTYSNVKNDEKKQQEKKVLYKMDVEGYLMDEEGKYLIDQNNKMIMLSQQKIKLLHQSHLIEFV